MNFYVFSTDCGQIVFLQDSNRRIFLGSNLKVETKTVDGNFFRD